MTNKPPEDVTQLITEFSAMVSACGSRVTCDPSPIGTDADFLVLTYGKSPTDNGFAAKLIEAGFVREGDEKYFAVENKFESWRRGEINLIITASSDFFVRHEIATALCTRLNLLNKLDRIAVFQAVLYHSIYNGKG